MSWQKINGRLTRIVAEAARQQMALPPGNSTRSKRREDPHLWLRTTLMSYFFHSEQPDFKDFRITRAGRRILGPAQSSDRDSPTRDQEIELYLDRFSDFFADLITPPVPQDKEADKHKHGTGCPTSVTHHLMLCLLRLAAPFQDAGFRRATAVPADELSTDLTALANLAEREIELQGGDKPTAAVTRWGRLYLVTTHGLIPVPERLSFADCFLVVPRPIQIDLDTQAELRTALLNCIRSRTRRNSDLVAAGIAREQMEQELSSEKLRLLAKLVSVAKKMAQDDCLRIASDMHYRRAFEELAILSIQADKNKKRAQQRMAAANSDHPLLKLGSLGTWAEFTQSEFMVRERRSFTAYDTQLADHQDDGADQVEGLTHKKGRDLDVTPRGLDTTFVATDARQLVKVGKEKMLIHFAKHPEKLPDSGSKDRVPTFGSTISLPWKDIFGDKIVARLDEVEPFVSFSKSCRIPLLSLMVRRETYLGLHPGFPSSSVMSQCEIAYGERLEASAAGSALDTDFLENLQGDENFRNALDSDHVLDGIRKDKRLEIVAFLYFLYQDA